MLLRLRTKDGTERIQIEQDATLARLKHAIRHKLNIDTFHVATSKPNPNATHLPTKGDVLHPDEAHLATLGVANGAILFIDYAEERQNQAVTTAYKNDPFRSLVKEGELRAAGSSQWTLTSYLDHRATKEFVLGATPEPHTAFVMVDAAATQGFINHMIGCGWGSKRLGHLYGRWIDDEEGKAGVQVHAIYEPPQECTADEIRMLDDADGAARVAKLARALGLTRVGVILAHPAREYAFTVNEVLLAARFHAEALADDADGAARFVTMKARPVLESETEIEGVATVEAYQLTDQAVELCTREPPAFAQSKNDPRVAKTPADCCFVIEKKEQRKSTMEPFVSRIFDMARPFKASVASNGFAVENRPTEPQSSATVAQYLRSRRSRGEPFDKSLADFHLLLFLATHVLDVDVDVPILCGHLQSGGAAELDGFRMMINCFAGLD